MLLSHAKEAAEAEHRISDVPAELIDHEALDGADLAAIGTADRGAFDPVAGNQAMGLARRRVGLHSCLHQPFRVRQRLGEPRTLAFVDKRFGGLRRSDDQNSGGNTPDGNCPRKTAPSANRTGNATAGLPSSTARWPSAATKLGAALWRAIPPSPGINRSRALNVAPICPSDMMRSMSNILRSFSMPTTVTSRSPSSPPPGLRLRTPVPTAITPSCANRALVISIWPSRACHSLNRTAQGPGEMSFTPRSMAAMSASIGLAASGWSLSATAA